MRDRFFAIGVDPDTFATGFALVSCDLHCREFEVERVRAASAEGPDARARLVGMANEVAESMESLLGIADFDADVVVIEGQSARPGDKRPDNIVQLAVVQGMAAGALRCFSNEETQLTMPLPVQWKGTRKKERHQADLLKRLGLTAELDGVSGTEDMTKKQRGHVVDAIGLAVWGLEKLTERERMARFLA